ncbi:MAG: hypothetical protein KBT03_04445 [Bacteroidales bacterium]|nr:hypothetical protein [Candidatus Scybalousia scybalohippi]
MLEDKKMAIFKIRTFDLSPYIMQGQYTINEIDQYEEWIDAGGNTHRSVSKRRCEGSLKVKFCRVGDYENFIHEYRSARNMNGTVTCTMFVNNTNSVRTNVEAFLDFEPTKNRNGSNRDIYDEFVIEVTER